MTATTSMKPGIYRGGSPATFGLWRLREDGVWLFSMPVKGSAWVVAEDQSPDKLTPLVDEDTAENEAVAKTTQRIHSTDVEHLKEDLEASLRFALGDEYTDRATEVQAIIDGIEEYGPQTALRTVKEQFGAAVFGQVTLYHFENETSVMGHAEVLTFPRNLAKLGMTVADLGWPDEALKPMYQQGEGGVQ